MKIRGKKGIPIGGICLVLWCSIWMMLLWSFGVRGAEEKERIVDEAGLFSDEERSRLEERSKELEKKMKGVVLVLTTADTGGKSAAETVDSAYFDRGYHEEYGEDGLVFLIDLDNREIYLGVYGDLIPVLTDQRIEAVLDEAYPFVTRGDYGEAAGAALAAAAAWYDRGVPSGQYTYQEDTGKIVPYRSIRWYEVVFALAAGGGIAGSVCLGVVRSYKMKEGGKGANQAMAFREGMAFHARPGTDLLLRTTVTHVPIVRHSSGSRGPRGSGPRSTTHSYRGHRAGGGGRKF